MITILALIGYCAAIVAYCIRRHTEISFDLLDDHIDDLRKELCINPKNKYYIELKYDLFFAAVYREEPQS